jgi:hypothetical protein
MATLLVSGNAANTKNAFLIIGPSCLEIAAEGNRRARPLEFAQMLIAAAIAQRFKTRGCEGNKA